MNHKPRSSWQCNATSRILPYPQSIWMKIKELSMVPCCFMFFSHFFTLGYPQVLEGWYPPGNDHISVSRRVHPRKLTWNPKMEVWKMLFLFKQVIFMFHVSFRGSTFNSCGVYVLHLPVTHCRPRKKPSFARAMLRAFRWRFMTSAALLVCFMCALTTMGGKGARFFWEVLVGWNESILIELQSFRSGSWMV